MFQRWIWRNRHVTRANHKLRQKCESCEILKLVLFDRSNILKVQWVSRRHIFESWLWIILYFVEIVLIYVLKKGYSRANYAVWKSSFTNNSEIEVKEAHWGSKDFLKEINIKKENYFTNLIKLTFNGNIIRHWSSSQEVYYRPRKNIKVIKHKDRK